MRPGAAVEKAEQLAVIERRAKLLTRFPQRVHRSLSRHLAGIQKVRFDVRDGRAGPLSELRPVIRRKGEVEGLEARFGFGDVHEARCYYLFGNRSTG